MYCQTKRKTQRKTMTEKLNEAHVKDKKITIRLNVTDYYEIKRRALLYCDGKISTYIRYAAKHYTINRHDILDGTPRAIARRQSKANRGGLTVKEWEKKNARKK